MLVFIAKRLLYAIIRTLLFTYRIEKHGIEHYHEAKKSNNQQSFLMSLWHEQVLGVMLAHAWTDRFLVMASRSKDGDFAAYISEKLGMVPVRASSRKKGVDKGGKEAIELYTQEMIKGRTGGLTVDGPKGPRRVCKPGICIMASRSGCAILPVQAVYSSYWEFSKAWDKFKLPKPFSKMIVHYGPIVKVPANASSHEIDEACRAVESSMNIAEENALKILKA